MATGGGGGYRKALPHLLGHSFHSCCTSLPPSLFKLPLLLSPQLPPTTPAVCILTPLSAPQYNILNSSSAGINEVPMKVIKQIVFSGSSGFTDGVSHSAITKLKPVAQGLGKLRGPRQLLWLLWPRAGSAGSCLPGSLGDSFPSLVSRDLLNRRSWGP